MTSDVIDTARRARQAGGMTNIGEIVAVVQVELLDQRLVESAT